jgi:uncharacterized membrane protein YeaQ/YmgE (transglycosylase-associated protein family)
MGILAWLIVGLIAGYLGSLLVNRSGEGMIRDIVLGIVGAFVGGYIFTAMGSVGVTGLDLRSIMVATVGAVVLLVLYHAIAGGRSAAV